MPDTVRLRNISPHHLEVVVLDDQLVEPGEVVEFDGRLVTDPEDVRADLDLPAVADGGPSITLADDAWHIASHDRIRAWPKAHWDLVPATPAEAAKPAKAVAAKTVQEG